jgi:hypothetical protein
VNKLCEFKFNGFGVIIGSLELLKVTDMVLMQGVSYFAVFTSFFTFFPVTVRSIKKPLKFKLRSSVLYCVLDSSLQKSNMICVFINLFLCGFVFNNLIIYVTIVHSCSFMCLRFQVYNAVLWLFI